MTVQNNNINIHYTEHSKSLPNLSTKGLDSLVKFLIYSQSKLVLESTDSSKNQTVA